MAEDEEMVERLDEVDSVEAAAAVEEEEEEVVVMMFVVVVMVVDNVNMVMAWTLEASRQ
jgi:hypothetical protein